MGKRRPNARNQQEEESGAAGAASSSLDEPNDHSKRPISLSFTIGAAQKEFACALTRRVVLAQADTLLATMLLADSGVRHLVLETANPLIFPSIVGWYNTGHKTKTIEIPSGVSQMQLVQEMRYYLLPETPSVTMVPRQWSLFDCSFRSLAVQRRRWMQDQTHRQVGQLAKALAFEITNELFARVAGDWQLSSNGSFDGEATEPLLTVELKNLVVLGARQSPNGQQMQSESCVPLTQFDEIARMRTEAEEAAQQWTCRACSQPMTDQQRVATNCYACTRSLAQYVPRSTTNKNNLDCPAELLDSLNVQLEHVAVQVTSVAFVFQAQNLCGRQKHLLVSLSASCSCSGPTSASSP